MYRRGDVGQVARALRILDALRGFKHGRLVSELAIEVGMSERTVKRDLEALQDAGIDISREPIDGRAAARLKDRAYSYVAITKRERYTLLAVRRMFDVLKGTSFAEDVESVLRKLEQRMTPEERAEHATFGERFAYLPDGGTKQYTDKDDVIDALLSGVLSRKLVRYAYRGARGRAQRGILAPFAMLLHKHGLYVLGKNVASPSDVPAIDIRRCRQLGGRAVHRSGMAAQHVVRAAARRSSSTTTSTTYRACTSARDRLSAWSSSSARSAQRTRAGGRGIARRRSRSSATAACASRSRAATSRRSSSWILEWGPHAKVIEPPELVDEVVRELRGALYESPPATA